VECARCQVDTGDESHSVSKLQRREDVKVKVKVKVNFI